MSRVRSHIMVCAGTGCTSSKSPEIIEAFEKELKANGLEPKEEIVKISARLIANKASFKFKSAAIRDITEALRKDL